MIEIMVGVVGVLTPNFFHRARGPSNARFLFSNNHQLCLCFIGDQRLYAIKKVLLDGNESRNRKLRLEAKIMETLTSDVPEVYVRAAFELL